jgi:nucleotide-binding universal stress UspA family protein
MFKRILVAVDGSPTANLGLRQAVELAADQGAELMLVHVVDEFLPMAGMEAVVYPDEFLDSMKAAGEKVLSRAAAVAVKRGIKPRTALVETLGGPAADVIVKQAKRWRADLIVLGTHGRRGLRRIVLGSDAELVVRASAVPVLLVRAKAASRSRRKAK